MNGRSGPSTSGKLRPAGLVVRSRRMPVTIDMLHQRMEEAVAALDFEEARRCRDTINAMRSGATADDVEAADFAGLQRQQPGAMGLGTSRQKVTPPPGWQPPPRPDPMTAGRSKRDRRPS